MSEEGKKHALKGKKQSAATIAKRMETMAVRRAAKEAKLANMGEEIGEAIVLLRRAKRLAEQRGSLEEEDLLSMLALKRLGG